MPTTLQSSLNAAITLREAGELSDSAKKFAILKEQIKQTDQVYTTFMAEYIIQLRLEAKSKLMEALKLAQDTLDYDQKNQLKNPLSLRSLSHVLSDLGGFELAQPLLSQICEMYPNNSLRRGEAQAHLALAWLRMGKVAQANTLVGEALAAIRANTASDHYAAVRESYALIVRALICHAKGDDNLAKENAKQALSIARSENAYFRIKEAEELLKLFG